ncbi:MAG: hypothetical protein NZM18_13785 [Thermoflexales bacterium]|nr:hypothetical protein [Thermoflexales bacterium]MDW8350382.1 hypothetical protein [Anaerolineae bacterium]
MPLDYADFRALVEALQANPEWRAELRRLVLTDELLELPNLVRELVEAQRRSEERITRLEQAVAELVEAQRRTDQHVDELAATLQDFRATLNRLQQTFGATLEEEAASVLEVVMRDKGFRALGPETTLALDGELDVLMPFEDSEKRKVWALVETKARLNRRDVWTWLQRARDAVWQRRLADSGVDSPYYLYFYAIRVDRGALELIQSAGVGLLKSDGEVVAPQELISLS